MLSCNFSENVVIICVDCDIDPNVAMSLFQENKVNVTGLYMD